MNDILLLLRLLLHLRVAMAPATLAKIFKMDGCPQIERRSSITVYTLNCHILNQIRRLCGSPKTQRVQSTYIVECRVSVLGIGIMIWKTIPHNTTYLGPFGERTVEGSGLLF